VSARVPFPGEALDRGDEGTTVSKEPRRIAWRLRMLNHVSTWFIQDADVGVILADVR